jgi:DNA polymerase-3 subunit alpha
MVEGLPEIQKVARKRIKDEAKGIMSLFETQPPVDLQDGEEYDPETRLTLEKQTLGVYISDHPLNKVIDVFDNPGITSVIDLPEIGSGYVTIIGLVSGVKKRKTKKGDLMAVFMLEDLNASVEIVVFPKTMYSFSQFIHDDEIIRVKGRVDTKDDNFKFIAQTISRVDLPA